ncbi:MAG: alpha/beta fold hydrolase, partial [Woeseia sp.]
GVAAQTERLHAFCTELGLEQIHLTGNSMGGFIALNYALTHGNQLKSLTLIDNAGVTGTSKSELELAIDVGANPLVATSIDDFDRLLKFIMHKQIPTPKFLKKAMFEIHRRHFDFLDGIFWTIVKGALEHPLTDRLGDVAMPTLILWGRHDRLIDVSCADVMADAIPDNKVVVLEGAGHIPMIECPAESSRHQIAFIAGGNQ